MSSKKPLEFNPSHGSAGLSVVLVLITLYFVIITAVHFILNNKVSVIFPEQTKKK